jgi:hypothetical protein
MPHLDSHLTRIVTETGHPWHPLEGDRHRDSSERRTRSYEEGAAAQLGAEPGVARAAGRDPVAQGSRLGEIREELGAAAPSVGFRLAAGGRG